MVRVRAVSYIMPLKVLAYIEVQRFVCVCVCVETELLAQWRLGWG